MTDAQTVPVIEDDSWVDDRPAAVLRGSAKGLEIFVRGVCGEEAIAAAVESKLAEAPAFFRGSDVRIRVEDGKLPGGCLARLDRIAGRFELTIVEVGAVKVDAVPQPSLAAGSEPATATDSPLTLSEPRSGESKGSECFDSPALRAGSLSMSGEETETVTATETATETATATDPYPVPVPVPVPDPDVTPGSQSLSVIGPVRSGVVLEHDGHIIIFGDVNPGAEIRASGNIVVLGRLRGTAHAAIGRDAGFIIALRLEPQQLRISRQLARASDSDGASPHPEIAHVAGGNIIVERYHGRLPGSLSASI